MPVVILPIILENTISFKYILFIASIIKLTYLFRYMTALHPTIKWAQRKDKIFVTLGIRDIQAEKVQLKEDSIKFQCTATKNKYQFAVQFFEPIVVQQSKWSKTGFNMVFILSKKDKTSKYWPRLTKQNKKTQYIQIDWDKWVDEDEEEEEGGKGLGGINEEGMNNFNDSDDQEENVESKQADIGDLDQKEEVIQQKN